MTMKKWKFICVAAALVTSLASCSVKKADSNSKTTTMETTTVDTKDTTTTDEHQHTFDEGNVKTPAGCTSTGVMVYTCSVCGYEKEEAIEAIGHKYSEDWSYDEESHYHSCNSNDAKKDEASHNYEITTVENATDDHGGIYDYTCSICGYTKQVDESSHVHDFGELNTIVEDCELGGSKEYTCLDCGYKYTHSISPTEHKYEVSSNVPGESCSVKGSITYECTTCHKQYSIDGDYGEHSYEFASHEVLPTCLEAGSDLYKCSVCNSEKKEVVEATGHSITSVTGKSSTCLEDGYKDYEYCDKCSYTTYETISATGHTYVHHDAVDSTCTTEGNKAYDTCEKCDYTTYQALDLLPHSPVTDAAVEATALKTGLTEGSHCKNCDYVIVPQKTAYLLSIEVANGDYGNVEIDSYSLAAGDTVDLLATLGTNHGFYGWVKDLNVLSESLSYTYTMVSSNTTLTAYFTEYPNTDVWLKVDAEEFEGGSGTSSDPYLIRTANQLYYLSLLVKDINTSYQGSYYKLLRNIDLNGKEWTPIGTYGSYKNSYTAKNFVGNFDGSNFMILNLTITSKSISTDDVSYLGLFGCVSGESVIKNVNLKHVNISINSQEALDAYVGGLIGYANGNTSTSLLVSNVSILSDKYLISTGNNLYAGLAVGYFINSHFNFVSTSGSISTEAVKENITGGIGGKGSGSTAKINDFNSCGFDGDISASGATVYCGGLSGTERLYSGYTSCIVTADIIVESDTCYVGGLVGSGKDGTNTVKIDFTKCSYSGNIECYSVTEGKGTAYVCGISYGGNAVEKTYSTGVIKTRGYSNSTAFGIGFASSFNICYSIMDISIEGTSKVAAGGLGNSATYTNCYYKGKMDNNGVSFSSTTTSGFGGICYGTMNSSSKYCYAYGSITLEGNASCGGIANEYFKEASSCLSAMSISVTGKSSYSYIGYLAGYSTSTADNSNYYLYGTTLTRNGETYSHDADKVTVTPSVSEVNFWVSTMGFSTDYWKITGGFPTLKMN